MKKQKYIYPQQQSYIFSKIIKNGVKKRQAKEFDESFYNSLTHEYEGEEFGKILASSSTSGNCYFYALLLARAIPNSTLKIGYLNTLNTSIRDEYFERFGHSWVEVGSKVYDTTARTVFDKEFYYKYFGAEPTKSVDYQELCDDVKFFALGLNAVRYRPELFNKYKEYTKNIYSKYKSDCDDVIKDFNYENYPITQMDIENLFK